jgi:hypothetical protein
MKCWDAIDEKAEREARAILRINRLSIRPRSGSCRITHKICEMVRRDKRS